MDVWIKLHSKIMSWEWYKDSNTKSVFIHCLLKANWRDGKFKGIIVPRGSFVTSYKTLSEELSSKKSKVSVQSVRTALNHLVSTQEITIKTTNKFTIITVNNYNSYQDNNKLSNNQLTNNQQTTNNQLTTIEEYKNINNNNYINKIEQNFGRTLAPLEIEMIERWISENSDMRKIDYAIKETITNGVRNLRYTNTILENIKNKNYEELITKEKEEESDILDILDYDWLNE